MSTKEIDIPSLRLINQQLLHPRFSAPDKLVSWMGAIQAQNINMAKWAVGIRLRSASLKKVEKAINDGSIIRTHVMRPTWHFVAAKDIRWMIALSSKHLERTYTSYSRIVGNEISTRQFIKSNDLLERILCGGRCLTKQEIALEFERAGWSANAHQVNYFLCYAEAKGVVCSGGIHGNTHLYALLEERVPQYPELSKENALASLARAYFRSHSPASLKDFTWWSGLTLSEAKQAVSIIENEMTEATLNGRLLYIYNSSRRRCDISENLHLLPAFDEYLIAYNDRTDVLPQEYYAKGFTKNGLFFPVILHKGQITGNWKKINGKGEMQLNCSYFRMKNIPNEDLQANAIKRYIMFH